MSIKGKNMKKNIISILIGCGIGVIFGVTAINNQTPVTVFAKSQVRFEEPVEADESSEPRHLTYAEKLLIASCVYAEANTEDLTGKRYVVDVILNRLDSSTFPNTVSGVIYEQGQFWTQGMPSDYSQIPDDCFTAVEMELESQLTYEAVYFRNGRFHNFGTALFRHENHYFSK